MSEHHITDNHGLPQLPPADVTNQQLYILLLNMNNRMGAMEKQIKEQDATIEQLAAAWSNAQGVVRFFKVLSWIGGFIALIFGLAKLLKTGN